MQNLKVRNNSQSRSSQKYREMLLNQIHVAQKFHVADNSYLKSHTFALQTDGMAKG